MNENVSLNQDVTSTESAVEPTNDSQENTNINDDTFLNELFNDDPTEIVQEDLTEDTTEEESEEQDDETVEDENEEETEEDEDTTEDSEDSFLTIKYNGEDENLTKEQAIELAQKGRNYDKKEQQYQDVKARNEQLEKAVNSKAMLTLNAIAKEWGMSADQFADYLLQNNEQNKISNQVKRLKEQFPDTDENVLFELAKANLKEKALEQEKQAINLKANETNEKQQKIQEEIESFHNKYPNVTDNDLTEDVIENIKKGMNVTQAWETHLSEVTKKENERLKAELEKKKEELEAFKKNTKVKRKSTGSLTSKSTSMNDNGDVFIKELFS